MEETQDRVFRRDLIALGLCALGVVGPVAGIWVEASNTVLAFFWWGGLTAGLIGLGTGIVLRRVARGRPARRVIRFVVAMGILAVVTWIAALMLVLAQIPST